ncbi:MAG: HlyD family efflux transporter periplasmic adaptor subunit [Vicinamibacterales bacterium]
MRRVSRSIWLLVAAVAVIAGLNLGVLARRGPGAVPAENGAAVGASPVAGPGLVEPKSESIRIGAQVSGRLQRVLVEEGDMVTAGQVIAEIANDDYRARVASAEADLSAREADARRVKNGARVEERREAEADARQAAADFDHAVADHARAKELFDEKVISRAEMDKAEQALRVAAARADSLKERHALVDGDAREEDRARAGADVALARARVNEARALYDKTFVRSPIDAVVLRRHARIGESVSTQFDSPIVTIADRSSVRVRMDVDEADVARIAVGQMAYVTADAYGTRRFAGRVLRIGRILGRKNIRTDEPTERVDQKVLETLIELEDGRELPIGLRVRAFIGE